MEPSDNGWSFSKAPKSSSAPLTTMEVASSSSTGDPCCGLCQAQRAPYTCPRCHLRFCSVPCYQSHGSCAQDFQNRELQLRLQGLRGDEASRRRLRDALLRLRELREPGDADTELGLDPDFEQEEEEEQQLWKQLSPEQQKAFQKLLNSGEISALLPPWKPWWDVGSRRGAALVEELGSLDAEKPPNPLEEEEKEESKRPEQQHPQETSVSTQSLPQTVHLLNSVPAVIAPLSSLTTSPVSPLVRFQLPNVLYGYAYSLSLYNGDVDEGELLPEFCETVLDISGALGAKQVYQSVAEALQGALQAVTIGRYPECPLGNAGVMVAVGQILMGECQAKQKGYPLAALSHLSRLLGKGKRRVPAQDRGRMFGAKKKCDFLLSWVNENEAELTLLALAVQREYKAHVDTVQAVGAVTQELEKMWGGKVPPSKKPLIEELD